MDPESAIVGALAAGAAAGLGEAASSAGRDAYGALKWLLKQRLAGSTRAQFVLHEHEQDPEAWEAPLRRALVEAGLDEDPDLLDAARDLLAILDPSGAAAGEYTVRVDRAHGVQIGDGNLQTNEFDRGGPPGPDFPSEP